MVGRRTFLKMIGLGGIAAGGFSYARMFPGIIKEAEFDLALSRIYESNLFKENANVREDIDIILRLHKAQFLNEDSLRILKEKYEDLQRSWRKRFSELDNTSGELNLYLQSYVNNGYVIFYNRTLEELKNNYPNSVISSLPFAVTSNKPY